MVYFLCKLPFKFRKNKNYSYNFKFSYRLYAKQYINLKLKFRKDKSYHQKGATRWNIVISMLLKPLKQSLIDVTSFRLSKSLYSRSVLFKLTCSFGSVFTNLLDRRIYETKFHTHTSAIFFPPFSISHITSNVPSTLIPFFCSSFQPRSSTNVARNCNHKLSYIWNLQFLGYYAA